MRTGIGRPSRPGSLEKPMVSMSCVFWNSSIRGWRVSNGRPSLVSTAAPLSWSANANVRSSKLATRSLLTGIKQEELRGAASEESALAELGDFLRGRQPVGHGARLDVDFLVAAGHWDETAEILDTLDVARILMPAAASHSLPLLATELGFGQPRPHRALDDADATRQLLLRLREEAVGLEEGLKEPMLALVAPYTWPIARFFADALSAANPDPMPASTAL